MFRLKTHQRCIEFIIGVIDLKGLFSVTFMQLFSYFTKLTPLILIDLGFQKSENKNCDFCNWFISFLYTKHF
jgi:hypothetical protein